MKLGGNLSKREHQIMDLAYERGTLTSGELEELLPGRPSNSAIRVHLRSLEAKGLLDHIEEPGRFVYRPTKPREEVARVELARLVGSFFGGSPLAAVTTLLDQERDKLSSEDLAHLRKLIDRAEAEGR